MNKSLTIAQVAAKEGVNKSRIQALAAQKRIKGAKKIGRRWFIAENYVILPPKLSKTAQAAKWLEDNPSASQLDSAHKFNIHPSGLSRFLKLRKNIFLIKRKW